MLLGRLRVTKRERIVMIGQVCDKLTEVTIANFRKTPVENSKLPVQDTPRSLFLVTYLLDNHLNYLLPI